MLPVHIASPRWKAASARENPGLRTLLNQPPPMQYMSMFMGRTGIPQWVTKLWRDAITWVEQKCDTPTQYLVQAERWQQKAERQEPHIRKFTQEQTVSFDRMMPKWMWQNVRDFLFAGFAAAAAERLAKTAPEEHPY